MIPFEQIDERLSGIDKDRKWLAEVTGRSAGAIRSALAPSASEKHRSELLQKALSDAIEREEGRKAEVVPDQIALTPTPEQFEAWDRASRTANADTLKGWIIDELNKAAAEWRAKITPIRLKADIQAAAGSPICAEVVDWEGGNDTITVKINGLSMVPTLHDGDVVPMKLKRISRSPYMRKGLIYLVAYDGGYTVKRYNTRPATAEEAGEEWVENGKVKVLESDNEEFPEIVIKQPLEWVAWLDEKA